MKLFFRIIMALWLCFVLVLGAGSFSRTALAFGEMNSSQSTAAGISSTGIGRVSSTLPVGVPAGWWAKVRDSLRFVADPLPPAANTVLYGGVRQAGLGASLSIVGDVNGDGYDDMVVGAPFWGSFTGRHAGRAYLFLGSASGLATTPVWMVEGGTNCGNYYCNIGAGVGAAGDVNGDGFDDVIVATGRWSNGQYDEGRVFVYYGSPAGLGATADWIAEGNQVQGYFGAMPGTAGDVNGDGYDDIIIGSGESYTRGMNKAFVYLGSPTGLSCGTGCPVDATTAAAWTFSTPQSNANVGGAVSTAGDVNGDGFSDVVVGAQLYDEGGRTDAGKVWVFLGSSTGLSSTPIWSAAGDQAGARLGYAVDTAGDVNGDGYDDVLIGAYLYDNGQTDEGRAYLYLGSASGLAATPAWTAESDQTNAAFGIAVATAGDLNGDGYGDVAVGAHAYDNGQADEGRVWVYLGSAAGLNPVAAWTAESNQASASFGVGLARQAGDVNGDGVDDLIIGAHQYDQTYIDGGAVFIYHGIRANRPPVAEANGPYDVLAGEMVTLSGSGSSDPDAGDSLTYAWDLDGDAIYGETGPAAARGDEIGATPIFSAAGLNAPLALTVSLRVTDQGGLSNDDAATVTVADATPPVITPDVSGTLGSNDWYVGDVAVSWTVTDGESAVTATSGCEPTTLSADTTGVTLTCSATSAGGANNESVTVKLDKTGPSANLTVTAGTPGAQDWYTSDVTVSTSGSDDISGPVTCAADQYQTTDTPGTEFNGSCTNAAGLTAAAPLSVKRDATLPVITWNGGPADGGAYVFGSVPAAPTCTATDATSGPNGCTVVGYETAVGSHTLTATAYDVAGNSAIETHAYTVLAWTLRGFYSPVEMNGAYNSAKGGSTAPLKFKIFMGSTELTDVAAVKSLTYAQTDCDANTISAENEAEAAGGTGLRYDPKAGQFIYNWKTPRIPDACLRLTLTAQDLSTLVAYFKLK